MDRDSMLGRPLSDLETPALCLDLDTLDHGVRLIQKVAEQHRKVWRARCSFPQIPEYVSILNAGGARSFAVPEVRSAEMLAAAGVEDLLIWRPVVGQRSLQRLATLCKSMRPVFVCDHYAQAEAISDTAIRCGVRCLIALELNLGLNRTGMRAGSDARDLARGLLHLRGIELIGVMGDIGHCRSNEESSIKRIMSRVGMLEELREQIRRDGIADPVITVFGAGAFEQLCSVGCVDEIQADPLAAMLPGNGPPPLSTAGPSLKLVATVLSRPKLERAVLDAGTQAIAGDPQSIRVARTTIGRDLSDATIEEIGPETMTLCLGPVSQDLIIGETVELWPDAAPLTSARHRTLYGLRSGTVERIWPV